MSPRGGWPTAARVEGGAPEERPLCRRTVQNNPGKPPTSPKVPATARDQGTKPGVAGPHSRLLLRPLQRGHDLIDIIVKEAGVVFDLFVASHARGQDQQFRTDGFGYVVRSSSGPIRFNEDKLDALFPAAGD